MSGTRQAVVLTVQCVLAICLLCNPLARAAAVGGKTMTGADTPADTGPLLTISQIQVSGNTLISTEKLFAKMPATFKRTTEAVGQQQKADVYDLTLIKEIIASPGESRRVTARSVQGLTQYILSVYEKAGYGGIYVHVPANVIANGDVAGGILKVEVKELPVSSVNMKFYNTDGNEVEKTYLKRSALEDWSPVEVGKVVNKRELDYRVNMLNLDPDRYIAANVASGTEPNSLAVNYDVYESNPWHEFIQLDNSGTRNRRWAPRVGIINTNLLGYDDRFSAVYQAKPEKGIENNYSIYGNYDFPLFTPRLRLMLYAGHSEFDINPESGAITFLGSGTFYGGTLRYNLLQHKGWFFDVTGSLSGEESNVTPSLFPQFLASSLEYGLWGTGAQLHRRTDMSRTSLSADMTQSMRGSSRAEFNKARANADPDFIIYSFGASHSQFLDQNKVQNLRGTMRWITTEDRLVPAKMTSFGGMYTVRGYEEYDTIADGGLLFSVQYEYDLIRANATSATSKAKGNAIRKLAPLAFFDYGRSRTSSPQGAEKAHEELMSVGFGGIVEIGKNFSGAIYCGYPIEATTNTGAGKGTVNVSFMLRN